MRSPDGSAYDAFAARVVESGIVTDPWLDGAPRFRVDPLVLPAARWRELARAGEDLAAVYDEVCAIVGDDPALLEDFDIGVESNLIYGTFRHPGVNQVSVDRVVPLHVAPDRPDGREYICGGGQTLCGTLCDLLLPACDA